MIVDLLKEVMMLKQLRNIVVDCSFNPTYETYIAHAYKLDYDCEWIKVYSTERNSISDALEDVLIHFQHE